MAGAQDTGGDGAGLLGGKGILEFIKGEQDLHGGDRVAGAPSKTNFFRWSVCGDTGLLRPPIVTGRGRSSVAKELRRPTLAGLMRLKIPEGDFAGYIFDLDGTLVDTMPLHYRAWDETMRRVGLACPLDEELFYSLGGVPTRRVAELIAAHYGLKIDPHKVFDHKESIFRALQQDAKLIEPVVEFARRMALTHPVSIASGGPRDIVRRMLELTGLATLFKVVVTPEDVTRGKPAPDMFLLAASRMGVPAVQCLVFEDADAGLRAADSAGMAWVRVSSRKT